MQLSSYSFIFIFLPIVLFVYYRAKRYRKAVLLFSSAVFTACSGLPGLAVLAASVFINYRFSLFIRGKKNVLICAVTANLLLLGWFKYFGSFFPLGISFYSIIQIDYLYALYRGEKPLTGWTDYAVYSSFFPRLSAGPLMDYSKQAGSFKLRESKGTGWDRAAKGLFLFSIGLFKKTVIADTLVQFVDAGYSVANINLLQSWATIICYAFMLYFDFSGYSDMAVAVASFLGYDLPINFNSPYLAEGIGDFWDRWHISLSKTLTRLVYIPLGGSRKGTVRTMINIMLVFLVSGIWHGAGICFVLWGLGHGLLLCAEKLAGDYLRRIPRIIRVFFTFIMVSLLWVPFRAGSLSKTAEVLTAAFNISRIGSFSSLGKLANDGIISFPDIAWATYLVAITAISSLIVFAFKNSNDLTAVFRPTRKNMYTTVCLLTLSVIHLSRLAIFVYTNF